MSTILANPNGAFVTVSDYRTGRDENGIPLVVGNQEIESFTAGGTILQGQALMFAAPTETAPITVAPMTAAISGSDPWLFAGVAMEGGVAGDMVRVCSRGICEILFDTSDTAAFASVVNLPYTTTGDFDVATVPADDVVPVGFCFGPEIGSTDKCLALIDRAGIAVPDEFAA